MLTDATAEELVLLVALAALDDETLTVVVLLGSGEMDRAEVKLPVADIDVVRLPVAEAHAVRVGDGLVFAVTVLEETVEALPLTVLCVLPLLAAEMLRLCDGVAEADAVAGAVAVSLPSESVPSQSPASHPRPRRLTHA